MSRHWLDANAPRLVAEILRDFCVVSMILEEQFTRFDNAGNLSYSVLRETLGDQMNKGILWRLKDTAHHLLRNTSSTPSSRLLDWAIGYIFHETLKLMEDAHQHQYYAPSLTAFTEDIHSPELKAATHTFILMSEENHIDMGRAVSRIRKLLAHARLFFHRCYEGKSANKHLARLLYDKEHLIQKAFAEEYENFIRAIYGNAPCTLFINAAISLKDGGKRLGALEALHKARAIAPQDPQILALAKELEASAPM